MQAFLQSILPRLQRYSKQLNDEANFVEVPWAYLDEDGVKITYLFRRSNELLVTRQGEVATGKWEYLPSMQSLLIEYDGKRRMYNQGFLDKAVLLLRKEGTEKMFTLANLRLLPDLNIENYLLQQIETVEKKDSSSEQKTSLKVFVKSGKPLLIWKVDDRPGIYIRPGEKVTMEDGVTLPPDGSYHLVRWGSTIMVKDGVIIENESNETDLVFIVVLIILVFVAIASVFLLGA